MNFDRRRFLSFAAIGGAAVIAGSGARAEETPACYDPAALPLSQKNRRRSLGYVEPSADPQKHCGLCAFFTAGDPGCGKCQLLNGPVSAQAVCSSFAPRGK
jgi:hypothetical protein